MTSQVSGSNPIDATKQVEVVADPYVQALNIIDSIHEMVHLGKHFVHSAEDTVANGANLDHLLVTGGAAAHLRISEIDITSAPFKIYLFEGTTVSANGTQQAAVNNNRLSTNTSNTQIYSGPTVTAPGTQLRYKLIPGTRQTGGDGTTYFNEWVLKPNTNYLVRITNASGTSATVGSTLEWYEP